MKKSFTLLSLFLISGIAASRVYLGVHWFTDIVQGALQGPDPLH